MRIGALALALVGLAAAPAAAGAEAVVEAFAPQGTAKAVRQVSARFSAPMVPLGDPRAADPFDVACEAAGRSRWADARTWVHTFEQDLPAGLRCRFALRADVRTLDGEPIGGPREFTFSTGGPAVLDPAPFGGLVAEDQRFALRLDAPATRESVERSVFLRTDALPDPIGVRIVEGPEREAVLATLDWSAADARHLVIEARQRLPAESQLVLHWGPGVETASGVATESAQTFEYRVRPRFTARLACDRENAKADCVPLEPIRLVFSAPVAWEAASRIVLRDADREDGARFTARRRSATDGDPFVDSVEFPAPLPPRTKLRAELPAELRDDAGRALPEDAEPLEIATGRLPPLAKFAARFGVLEAASPVLPVALRHVGGGGAPGGAAVTGAASARHARVPSEPAALLAWLHALEATRDEASIFARPGLEAAPAPLVLPPATPGEDAAELVGLPLEGAGLHVVEIESRLLGEALLDPPKPMFVAAGALVTNLAVHFKWGHEGSLAWVTTLDAAAPAAGVRVRVADCHGAVLAEATTDAQGLARLGGLPTSDAAPTCSRKNEWSAYLGGLLVVAERDGELGLAHSEWSEGIEPWRFGVETAWRPRRLLAHTVFARTLLRAGETVHMKHVLRRPVQAGLAAVPAAERPDRVRIAHVGSDDAWELPLAWAGDGSAVTEWALPRSAKLGGYEVRLLAPGKPVWDGETSGAFRVEAFRVPLLRAVLQPPAEPLVAATEVPFDLAVRYLAGGGASKLPVTLRSQLRRGAAPAFEAFEGFTFAAGAVEEGVRRSGLGQGDAEWERAWSWGEGGELGVVWRRPEDGAGRGPVATQELVLDEAGTGRAVVSGLPAAGVPLELQAELEMRDPNGETQTVSRSVTIHPSSRLVGLAAPSTLGPDDSLRVRGAVVDVDGAPVWWARVDVDVYERRLYSARKRVVGGFYAYEDVEEVRRVGPLCAARTDRSGAFACEAPAPARGELVLVARTTDWSWRESATRVSTWVAGEGESWFAQGDGDRMDLAPDRRSYEPGETARVQVRMPFREATALVTIEREGVADAFVAPLSGSDPVIEVPLRGEHAPNVFVSVLAVRGRTDAPAPTAGLDLARPAFRLGVTELRVGWRANELAVRVEPERERYRVREIAVARVRVRTPEGAAPPPGTEVALAAVDEGLLELWPNGSWKLLDAMMGRRAWGVRTATAQMQVVGKRHFGRKALPAGGGGGQRPTRELFDTLLLWRARVALDAEGEARVEIPLNDALTSFRIVAVATGGETRFGSGEAAIRTSQELMLFAGVPPLVREGDRFAAAFTVRNTTETPREVTLRPGVLALAAPLEPRVVPLAPGEAREVSWDVEVPAGASALEWEVGVESGGAEVDRLRARQAVVPAVPARVLQATLERVDPVLEVAVERPADALPGRGGLAVALRPRLADGVDGIARAMRAYPYACLEQRASIAVALRDAAAWQSVMDDLPSHLDGDGLARFFPSGSAGSVVLTAHLLAVANAAGFEIPAAARERMLGALARFVEGSLVRDEVVRAADLPLRRLAAAEALSRYGAATPEQVGAIAVEPPLLTNAALLDWIAVLGRVPGIPDREARLAQAETLLRARLDVQGSTLGFATSRGGALDWLLATSDVTAAKLVLSRLGAPGWEDDVPRLVRGLLALQRAGAWPTTTANAWGVLALEGFSQAYESAPVAGATTARAGASRERLAWDAAPAGGRFELPWPGAGEPLALAHEGVGAPWAVVQAVAAVPLRAPLASGYTISRRVEPVTQRTPGTWSRGDVARVRIEVDADADASWVVVSDPVPAGAAILGGGLGRDSALLAAGEREAGFAFEAFTERTPEAFRRFYEHVPKGRFALEYTVRLDQPGRFALPPTRVEAMYAPERMGELPVEAVEVAP